ncbi:MAG: [Fe-Fe] hydrogenase large subunit C-terminal domain-containing protein [Christensenellales bacterium]|jgi:iron only hydrogenase large subunit-like protein
MDTFETLYRKAIGAYVGQEGGELDETSFEDYEEHHLDCLLHPDKHPPVIRLSECMCHDGDKEECLGTCFFDALTKDEKGNVTVDPDACVGCGECVSKCKAKNLAERRDILPLLEMMHNAEAPVFAMIAPAFIGQFSEEVTPGKLRTAFKKLGFAGMIEVALFADILTLKEALEFDRTIKDDKSFMLTSCCCPIWVAMIRKMYNQLVPHMPASVSPMAACGRAIKKLYPNAKTVFIGPCVAKKAEAKEKDIKESVDFVLNFQEMRDVFEIACIDLADCEEDLRDHSSTGGRIYARTGGVSEAVQKTVERLMPGRAIPLKAVQADGAVACKKLLNDIRNGTITANFIEGMGCVGGCVGGPKVIVDKEKGKDNVDRYGAEAAYDTPANNPYVMKLLRRLGFNTIESLLDMDEIFTREFS